jgi:hypothetical protein
MMGWFLIRQECADAILSDLSTRIGSGFGRLDTLKVLDCRLQPHTERQFETSWYCR